MRQAVIFRLGLRLKDDDSHGGYIYTGTETEAERERKRCEGNGYIVETKRLIVSLTKNGLLLALNSYGGHPDNG